MPFSSGPFSSYALVLILAFTLFIGVQSCLAATPILQTDFEDGTLQGWIPRGGSVVLTNTTEAAAGGTHSLKTTGRAAPYNGPSIDLSSVMTRGQLYLFSVQIRMVSGEPNDTLKMTMQSTINGSNQFSAIASGAVTSGAWVTLLGTLSGASNATSLLLYIEGASATSSYYIDNFSLTPITGGCSTPPDTSGFASDFEDATKQGWTPNGNPTLSPTMADAHSGNYSLLVTGRTSAFNGPLHDATGKMCNGSRYKVTVWVKMAPGQPATQLRVSIRRTLGSTTNFNTVIGNTTVTSAGWVRLKTTYNFSFAYDTLGIYVESNNNPTASFYIDDFSLQYVPPPIVEDIPSVAPAYADDFLFGAAVWSGDLSGVHAELLTKHHNSVTAENDMKPDATQPSEGNFTFSAGDNIVNFAKSKGLKVRGHTLLWHNQTPTWFFMNNGVDMSTQPFSEANKQLLLQRMKTYIQTTIQHYGGNIYAWDVVNEPFDETQPDGFRRSKWYTTVGGPEYIDAAFQYAKEAVDALGLPPGSIKLYLNEFSTTVSAKRDFMLKYVKDALARGVPIDGIGHQFHNNLNWPINDDPASQQQVADAINAFAGLGLDNQITEFDISIYRVNAPNQTIYSDYDDIVALAQPDLIEQGYRYRDYFNTFRSLKGKISSVTLWGQADDHTWKTSGSTVNAPLLFDVNLQHKYAYTGVMSPLDLPGANLETMISAQPGTVLSGHAVTYTITVTNHGHDGASNVSMTDSLPAGTVFQSLNSPFGWSCTAPAVGSAGKVTCTAASLDNGAAAQFTLTLLLSCQTANGASISNTASVVSDTRDPNSAPNNSASVVVTVSNPPPVISGLAVAPAVLWPPNHEPVEVALAYQVTDNCDPTIVPAIAISSSDGDNGSGDGNTAGDFQVVDPSHVRLRAERSATSGVDRVYTITLTATDSQGYSSSSAVVVTVPHSVAY